MYEARYACDPAQVELSNKTLLMGGSTPPALPPPPSKGSGGSGGGGGGGRFNKELGRTVEGGRDEVGRYQTGKNRSTAA